MGGAGKPSVQKSKVNSQHHTKGTLKGPTVAWARQRLLAKKRSLREKTVRFPGFVPSNQPAIITQVFRIVFVLKVPVLECESSSGGGTHLFFPPPFGDSFPSSGYQQIFRFPYFSSGSRLIIIHHILLMFQKSGVHVHGDL